MAVPISTIQDEDRKFVETWESVADCQYAVIKFDARGDERPEVVQPGRRVMLTTEERVVTQDRVLEAKNDPFLNGSFRPVRVPETIDMKTNPNALSQEEILSVLRSSPFAWGEYMKTIDSPQTLRRMLELSEQAEVSLARYREVEAKLRQVKPQTRIEIKDRELYERIPGGEAAPDRAQGGRSRDYRAS